MRGRAPKLIAPRPAVARLEEYHAPEEGRAGKLRLDFNENTVGCSPAVLRALRKLTREGLAMYPEYQTASRRLAAFFGVRATEMLLTNGVDDALRLIVDTFVDRNDAVLLVEPTFPMYRFYAALVEARVARLRYDAEMRFPLEAVLRALRKRPRVFFLANPNNPTGTLLAKETICRLLEASPKTVLVVDEAYAEFSGVTVLPWIRRYPNLVVTRTFSKATGLAGLRLGCLFSGSAMIGLMEKARTPFPVNAAALVAAEAATRDTRFILRYVCEITRSREDLTRGLEELGIRVFPSAANFLTADFGSRGLAVVQGLARRGILLRDRSSEFGRAGLVRITVGTRAQTRRLLRAIEGLG